MKLNILFKILFDLDFLYKLHLKCGQFFIILTAFLHHNEKKYVHSKH
ncbi:Uncharacterised protein [Haemophilus aegyptius]|uniref:Uncharacterized protein n=1 Tax=Haemophilus aegyptius TaxID=197575 RepID=A0ABY1VW07_HAEAE|nr:hypothetical protein HMPREF9095_0992 [Haemophilus aegyptius ATCC 11116]SQH38164.1 Uncharacterised protein [Haemophilus aegyptius]VEH54446.1 Uncharacterised protein [Haemophilus aegyptius]